MQHQNRFLQMNLVKYKKKIVMLLSPDVFYLIMGYEKPVTKKQKYILSLMYIEDVNVKYVDMLGRLFVHVIVDSFEFTHVKKGFITSVNYAEDTFLKLKHLSYNAPYRTIECLPLSCKTNVQNFVMKHIFSKVIRERITPHPSSYTDTKYLQML